MGDNVLDKIRETCEKIKALPSKGSAFYNSLLYLKYLLIEYRESNVYREDELQVPDGYEWRTVNHRKICINVKNGHIKYGFGAGKNIRDYSELYDGLKIQWCVEKNPRIEKGSRCETPVKFKSNKVTFSKDGTRIYHYSHDENRMNSIGLSVKDSAYNKYTVVGSIKCLTVFAGDDRRRKLDIADVISNGKGGNKEKWKHVKGIAKVKSESGKEMYANIHWFENEDVGQFGFKIKCMKDEVLPEDVFWREEDLK